MRGFILGVIVTLLVSVFGRSLLLDYRTFRHARGGQHAQHHRAPHRQ